MTEQFLPLNSLKKLPFLWLFLLLACATVAHAATDKKLKKAIEKYNFQAYTEAIELFKKALEENKDAYTPLKYIAQSYRKINDYENSELYYTLVVNSDSSQAEDYLYYGQALKSNGKLAAAKEQFVKFSEKANNQFLGNLMVQSIDEIDAWSQEPKVFKSTVKSQLNTSLSEYNIQLFRDKYYITSNRETNFNSPESFSWNGTPYLSIFEMDTALLNTKAEEFKIVTGKLNTAYHDGPLTIDASESRAVITRIDNKLGGKKFVNRMKLFEGQFEDGRWKSFEPLPFNSDEYHVGHACYADSSTLYFVSDMPGGYGGMDLYVTKREGNNWGIPINLGPSINTQQNELFPYFKNNQLYFSSNGFSGYGGLDILVSNYSNGWQSPKNLKSPINSNRDDFGIYFITDSTGYYSSNREGGKGEDDLYEFYKSSKIQSVGVSGIFEYAGLPVEGTKVSVLDAKDSLIAVAYTDEKGRFKFSELAYQEDYFFEIKSTDDKLFEDGRLFLTNNDGDKIRLIERLKNGKFKFEALPAEEVELQLLTEEDTDELGNLRFAGQIFTKLPGDYTSSTLVYLVDDEGNIVDSVLTDAYGKFNFSKLELDNQKTYFVKLQELDDQLNLALINDNGIVYEISEAKDGKFYLSDPIDASQKTRIATAKGLTSLIGIAELDGKVLSNTKVLLYDNNSILIATLFTNEKGEFQFNKLKIDENYFVEMPMIDDKNAVIYVINEKGDHLYLINQLKDGKYTFTSLPYDEYEGIQFQEALEVPNLVELQGQIFRKLPGDYNQEMKVYLIDEDGGIIDSVYTNLDGSFNFEKLAADKNYTFRLEETEDINLALIGNEGTIVEQAVLNENGNFAYKKLTYQVAQFEKLEVVDVGLQEDELTHEIYGQVFQQLPGDFDHGMEVYIYDEDGKLVGTATTDKNGKFKFEKLDADKNYYFKIEDPEEDFQLITLDEEENILNKTIKNQKGIFKYQTLNLVHHKVILEEAKDHHQIVYIDNKKIDLDSFIVHYRFDSTLLNSVAMQTLNRFVTLFKDHDFKIQVQSHTDTRGSFSYNEALSKKRTDSVINYLEKKGIDRKRIIGKYFGEMVPIIDCELKKCDNDDHFLNRRTELKLIKPSTP